MSEGVTALFIIWFILSIGIYVLHEVTEYMIWKYIYSILLIVVPFYLFLLPVEEWIPGEAASLEEQMLIAALFLFLLFAVFWDYICSELEQKEKLAPHEMPVWLLAMIPIAAGLFYDWYAVTENDVLSCMLLWITAPVVFLRPYIINMFRQWRKRNWEAKYRGYGISGVSPAVIAVSGTASGFCLFVKTDASLLCGILLIYSMLCYCVYRMCCCWLNLEGRIMYGLLLWNAVLVILGVVIVLNFHAEVRGVLLWAARIVLGVIVPGMLLSFSTAKLYREWK